MEVFLIRSYSHYRIPDWGSNLAGKIPTKLVLAKGKNPEVWDLYQPHATVLHKQDVLFPVVRGQPIRHVMMTGCTQTLNCEKSTRFVPRFAEARPGSRWTGYHSLNKYFLRGEKEAEDRWVYHLDVQQVVLRKNEGPKGYPVFEGKMVLNQPITVPLFEVEFGEMLDLQPSNLESSSGFYPFSLEYCNNSGRFSDSRGSGIWEEFTNQKIFRGSNPYEIAIEIVKQTLFDGDKEREFAAQLRSVITLLLQELTEVWYSQNYHHYKRTPFLTPEVSFTDDDYLKDSYYMRTLHTIVITLQMMEKVIHPYIEQRLVQISARRSLKAAAIRSAFSAYFGLCAAVFEKVPKVGRWRPGESGQLGPAALVKLLRSHGLTTGGDADRIRSMVVVLAGKQPVWGDGLFGRWWKEAGEGMCVSGREGEMGQVGEGMIGNELPEEVFWRKNQILREFLPHLVNYAVTNSFGVVLEPKPWSHKLNVRKIYLGQIDNSVTFGRHLEVGFLGNFTSPNTMVIFDSKTHRKFKIPSSQPIWSLRTLLVCPRTLTIFIVYISQYHPPELSWNLAEVTINKQMLSDSSTQKSANWNKWDLKLSSIPIIAIFSNCLVMLYYNKIKEDPESSHLKLEIYRKYAMSENNSWSLLRSFSMNQFHTSSKLLSDLQYSPLVKSVVDNKHLMVVMAKPPVTEIKQIVVTILDHRHQVQEEWPTRRFQWTDQGAYPTHTNFCCKRVAGRMFTVVYVAPHLTVVVFLRGKLCDIANDRELATLPKVQFKLLQNDKGDIFATHLVEKSHQDPTRPKDPVGGKILMRQTAQIVCYRLKLV